MKNNFKRMISLLMAAVIFVGPNLTAAAAETGGSTPAAGSAEAAGAQAPGSDAAGTGAGTDPAGAQAPGSDAAGTGAGTDATGGGAGAGASGTDAGVPSGGNATDAATPGAEGTGTQSPKPQTPPVQGEVRMDQRPPVQGEVVVDKNNDNVQIQKNDRPYLALGADLTEPQRTTVLSIMGIDPANLSNYDVVYITNDEEHKYLGSYINAAQIGSRSLSSVVIVQREAGSGLNISTSNITYCTVGMYKNALTTAGIKDADIIVAGPTGISGTAALVGIFKAYQEMTGESINDSVVDAALNELVVTGELAASLEGVTNEEVEEFIAYIKSVIAENDLKDEASINKAIDDACKKYGVTLTDAERQQIVDLLVKITSLGIDLNGLVDYASSLYNSFKNGDGSGIFASIGDFFTNAFQAVADFFKGLFS